MKRKLLSLLLALTMILSLVTVGASAETTGTYGDLTYSITDGAVTITECDPSASGNLTIPSTIGGYPVTSIGDQAFYGTSLESVTIPEGVTSIGYGAFWNCWYLNEVDLPDSLTELGNRAFYDCSGLTSIVLPEGLKVLGEYAFYGCNGLESINIPASITRISYGAFCACSSLKEVVIPEGVTYIGTYAFNSCYRLERVSFPESLTYIDSHAFSNCQRLEQVTIPKKVMNIGWNVFSHCVGLSTIIFEGSAPVYDYIDEGATFQSVFEGVTATAYYPAGDATWTEDVFEGAGYGSNVTWIPYQDLSEIPEERGYRIEFYAPEELVAINRYTSDEIGVSLPDSNEAGWYFEVWVTDVSDGSAPSFKVGSNAYAVPTDENVMTEGLYDYIDSCLKDYVDDPDYEYEIKAVTSPEVYDYTEGFTLLRDGKPVTDTTTDFYFTTDYVSTMFYMEMTVGESCTLELQNSSGEMLSLNASYNFTAGPNGNVTVSGSTVTAKDIVNNYGETICLAETDDDGMSIGHTYVDIVVRRAESPDEPVDVTELFTDVSAKDWFAPYVQQAYDKGLMTGTGTNTFEPNTTTTRAMFVQSLYAYVGKPSVEMTSKFKDVKADAWYAEAVSWAVANNITSGTSENTFAPDMAVTREQIALFLYAYAGRPAVSGELKGFKDAANVHDYAVKAVLWCTQNGIISGSGNSDGSKSLNPRDNAKRSEVATMLVGFTKFMENQ